MLALLGGHGARRSLLAPCIVDLYTLRVERPGQGRSSRSSPRSFLRCFMPQMVFYGLDRAGHRDAPGAPAVLRRRVRADPQQPRRDRRSSSCSPSSPTGPITVADVSDDPSSSSSSASAPPPASSRWRSRSCPALHRAQIHLRFLPAWRHAAVRTMVRLSGWTVGYVIANQIALFVVLVLANGSRGGAFVYLARLRVLPAPARPVRGVDHDGGRARARGGRRARRPARAARTGSRARCGSCSR